MGWTYTYKQPGKSVVDFFKEQFNHENDFTKSEVIAGGVKNFKTAYMAYKITNKATGTFDVIALVCLLSYAPKSYNNFGWKDMDEGCGPCECDCPEKILKLLTPTTNEYALSWRKACWAKVNKRKEASKAKRALKKSLDKK